MSYTKFFNDDSVYTDEQFVEDQELLKIEEAEEMKLKIKKVKVKDSEGVKYYDPLQWFMFCTDHIDSGDEIKFIRA